MDVIKIYLKESNWGRVLDWTGWWIGSRRGRSWIQQLTVQWHKNSRKFLTCPTTKISKRTLIHWTSLKLSWSYSGDGESRNAHTGQQMVIVVVLMNCDPPCCVIVGHKQVDWHYWVVSATGTRARRTWWDQWLVVTIAKCRCRFCKCVRAAR
jgi:hypothetical protein